MTEASEAERLGALTLAREPRRSPRAGLSNLLSLNREAFISRGFGVLKMERVSRKRALWKYISRQISRKHVRQIYHVDRRPYDALSKAPIKKCKST